MKEILNRTQKMEKVKSLVIDKFNQIFIKIVEMARLNGFTKKQIIEVYRKWPFQGS